MSQLPAGDGSHVIDIDVDDRAAELKHQLAAPANHCHVIDIDVDDRKHGLAAPANHCHAIDDNVDGTAALPAELPECAVCMEHLSWVAVGPCGHREVCSKCAVHIRFVDRNLKCCICRTLCPTVVVTGRPNSTGDDGKHIYNKVSSLTLAAADEGRVGSYWYHKASAAYFDNEQPYDEAKRACSQLKRAAPEVGDQDGNYDARRSVVVILVYIAINLAALLGSGFGFAAMACIFWFLMDLLHYRRRRGRQQI